MKSKRKQYIFSIVISIIIPILIYFVLRKPLTDAYALIASSSIPIIRAIYVLIKRKKVDMLSIICIIGFTVSIVIFKLGNGNFLAIKLYHAIITGAIGLVILTSSALRKPILSTLLQRKMTVDIKLHDNEALIKKINGYNIMVGLVFLFEAVLHIFMACLLSTDSYVIFSKIATIALVGIILFLAAFMEKRKKNKQDN